MGGRVGEGQSTETVVGGKDSHRGHGQVCEGGVRQGMVKVRLLCFRWLLLSLSLCRRGFQDLLKVRPTSLLILCGCISSSVASLMSRSM